MEEGADHVSLGMVGDGKRCVREDEEEDVEEKGLDFGLDHHHYQQPQKLTRTDSFPFRAVSSDVLLTTGAHLPPLYPSSGIHINDGGPTAGGIYSYSGFDVDARPTWLQPYGSINGGNNYLKSQGIMGNSGLTNVRYPIFTSAQWQELKRQALIYKHFVSSAPIPPDLLLFDPTRSFPTIPPLYPNHGRGSVGGGGYFNLRFTNNTDPEPGRCRRTDGKKWRCSREVAPDHKYCERHMHRSRPRSRKPVEQQRQKTTTAEPIADISTTTITTAATGAGVGSEAIGNKPPIVPKALEKEPRYLEWMRGGFDMLHANNTSNHNMIGLRSSSPTPLSLNQYEEHLKVNYSDQNDPCYSFLRDDLSPGETNNHDHTREYPPRSFIDAWSNEKSPSRQTLSMSNTGGEDFSTHQIQMGLGLERSHSLSWMNPLPSPLGGPLAEVLHKSSTTTSSPRSDDGDGEIKITRSHAAGLVNPAGRNCCDSAKDNPLRVVVSSPTGVLQRTFLSLSDSSSNSSPTFAARSGRSEIGSQWICDNK